MSYSRPRSDVVSIDLRLPPRRGKVEMSNNDVTNLVLDFIGDVVETGVSHHVPLPLDPIDPKLPAAARVQTWVQEVRNFTQGRVVEKLMNVASRADLLGWCEWNGSHTQVLYSEEPVLHQLSEMNVLEADCALKETDCSFGRMILVPKNDKVSRAIADMRALNENCGKPPRFRLPSMEVVRNVLLAFGARSVFASWDFRHWYHQLPVPNVARRLFTFRSKRRTYMSRSWPMGFSWTPMVGQAIVTGGVLSIGKRIGLRPCYEGVDLPVCIEWKNSNGALVAISLVWADNVLIACVSQHVAEQWKCAVEKECSPLSANVRIKEPGVKVSGRSTDFLKVIWSVREDGLQWKHDPENVKRWSLLEALFIGSPSASNAARVCGVLYWDNLVRGTKLGRIATVVEVSRMISEIVRLKGSWDGRLEYQLVEPALVELRSLLALHGGRGCGESTSGLVSGRQGNEMLFCCSDATLVYFAGVMFNGDSPVIVVPVTPFPKSSVPSNINVKETISGLETLEQVKPLDPVVGLTVIIGIDNKTAVAAINCGFYPGDPELSRRIWKVHLEYASKGFFLLAVYVPGIIQVADEPTRGISTVTAEYTLKAKQCLQWMKESVGKSWSSVDVLLKHKEHRAESGQ